MRLFDPRFITDPAGNNASFALTHCGMAHFAQPDAKATCRQCVWWAPAPHPSELDKEPRFFRAKETRVLLDRPCRQFSRLMRGRRGERVPHDAKACKYFAESGSPPPYHH